LFSAFSFYLFIKLSISVRSRTRLRSSEHRHLNIISYGTTIYSLRNLPSLCSGVGVSRDGLFGNASCAYVYIEISQRAWSQLAHISRKYNLPFLGRPIATKMEVEKWMIRSPHTTSDTVELTDGVGVVVTFATLLLHLRSGNFVTLMENSETSSLW
jgi:hypothetical protein